MNDRVVVYDPVRENLTRAAGSWPGVPLDESEVRSAGGKHAEPAYIRLLLDGAHICATSADYKLRGSDFYRRTRGVCAEMCEGCAEDCARMEGDAQMQACAEACRWCATSCRQMAV